MAKEYYSYSIAHHWKTNYLTTSQNEADGDNSLKIGDCVPEFEVFVGHGAFRTHQEKSYIRQSYTYQVL